MDRNATFFTQIVELPQAYVGDEGAHWQAARGLFEQSVGFLKLLPLARGWRVIDIGAGYGFHCAYFAAQGYQTIGLSVHVTPDLEREAARAGYRFVRGEMHRLEFAEESCDLVWSHHSLEHSHSPLTALREWYRVLRKGGWLAVTVPPHKTEIVSGHFHTGWSVGQLLYLLGVAGFELRGGTYLEEGYNVRALVRRPEREFDPTGASWMFLLKDRLPATLRPHLRHQPASLGQYHFPGRIRFLNDERCEFWEEQP
jgi:SAM-dependent methyltransferase